MTADQRQIAIHVATLAAIGLTSWAVFLGITLALTKVLGA